MAKLDRLWRHVVILVCIVFALFPVIWIMSASLDPANSIAGQKLIPPNASFINYQRLFTSEQRPFGTWFLNTFKLCIITSFLVVLITALPAYAFSLRFRDVAAAFLRFC